MDLLSALPEDIFNEIIPYLTSKDVLKASLVSKKWYQLFGQSNQCMKKLTLKFSSDNYNNDLNPLLKTNRQYQNFIIAFDNHRKILKTGIELNIRAIFKKFAKSIVKLQTSHDFPRICELPKLKVLNYQSMKWRNYYKKCSNNFNLSGLIASCLNVNKLDIRCYYLEDNQLKIVLTAIKKMRNLKTLALNQVLFLKDFGPDECKFKLEAFVNRSFTPLEHINDFIKNHLSTLKFIKVTIFHTQDVPLILSEFPKLHTLHIYNLHPFFDIPEKIICNSTVRKLIITNVIYKLELVEKFAEILINFKSLQQFTIHELYPEFIQKFIACKSLKLVQYKKLSFDVTDDQKNYMNTNLTVTFEEIQQNLY